VAGDGGSFDGESIDESAVDRRRFHSSQGTNE
jgi:hypothetical protein